HLTSLDSASSSSMISLQRSMHSSQMYTPGPAMSFLTCFWDFPQNEHFSRSPPSPIRATYVLPACDGPAWAHRPDRSRPEDRLAASRRYPVGAWSCRPLTG